MMHLYACVNLQTSMENTLVLILVVMDDALVRLCDVNGHYYAEKS